MLASPETAAPKRGAQSHECVRGLLVTDLSCSVSGCGLSEHTARVTVGIFPCFPHPEAPRNPSVPLSQAPGVGIAAPACPHHKHEVVKMSPGGKVGSHREGKIPGCAGSILPREVGRGRWPWQGPAVAPGRARL